jgi:hypothetical protein
MQNISNINLTILTRFTFAIILSSSNAFSEEIVTSTAIGVAETKVAACEDGLEKARREAAQTASTIVQATTTSITNEKGTSATTDQSVTTTAYAKLIEKSESSKYDESTGKISCSVTAKFRAGFISEDIKNQTTGSLSTKETLIDSKYGEPFCSKIMQACFREIYNPLTKEFGVQILGGQNSRFKFAFFTKEFLNGIEYDVSTKELLLARIKLAFDESKKANKPGIMPIEIKLQGHEWSTSTGFRNIESEMLLYGLNPNSIGLLTKTPTVSRPTLEYINQKMEELYKTMEELQ